MDHSPARCHGLAARSLAVLALALPCLARAPAARGEAPAKLDEGLDADFADHRPVFVRMADQLFRKGGDYEAFCRRHTKDKRSDLREHVLQTLRARGDSSWKKVADVVAKMEADGEVAHLKRFWIVNGFACDAGARACRKLAALDAVAFVYLQRGPVRQHRRRLLRGAAAQLKAMSAQQKLVYRQVLAKWKDDTDEPLAAKGLTIPWNLKRIGADAAWQAEGATGRGVVVALCDSGLMVADGLVRALWRNPGEKLNGKDDDDNGYVDDLFGYDFAAGSFYCLGDSARLPHGSMCGGIVAGRPVNEKRIVTGVAPRARLMVLRGMGCLEAYEYALANGADVISMSYMWVRQQLGHYRGLYRTAHEHLAAGGVVAVGGAGNFARLPEGRQIALPKDIPCVIAAAGILEDGSIAPPSSRGPCRWAGVRFYDDYPPARPLIKPDVTGCFGGYPVWGRAGRFALRARKVCDAGEGFALIVGPQGNSFSGPHAGGVAALMLSANPELNAWQVKALMEQTCSDLGETGRDTTFGAGLLQAPQAVRAAKQAAKLTTTKPAAKGPPARWEPTANYQVKRIEGWSVLVHKAFLRDEPALCERTLTLLRHQLYRIDRTVPAAAVAKLRKVRIWVEEAEPNHPCMAYHPNPTWLRNHGMNPAKARCVEVANARNFLSWTRVQPWMVLHELSHGYHHQFLGGYENPEILAAYRSAMKAKRYDAVLRYSGKTVRAYAASNQMEYFAETTEAYFGTNDFYPFVRAELKVHDPKAYELLEKLWGVRRGVRKVEAKDAARPPPSSMPNATSAWPAGRSYRRSRSIASAAARRARSSASGSGRIFVE